MREFMPLISGVIGGIISLPILVAVEWMLIHFGIVGPSNEIAAAVLGMTFGITGFGIGFMWGIMREEKKMQAHYEARWRLGDAWVDRATDG